MRLSINFFERNHTLIVNSLNFEPEKERNDIIIQTNDNIEDSYESLINKFIIFKCIDIFRNQLINVFIN